MGRVYTVNRVMGALFVLSSCITPHDASKHMVKVRVSVRARIRVRVKKTKRPSISLGSGLLLGSASKSVLYTFGRVSQSHYKKLSYPRFARQCPVSTAAITL